MFIAGHSILDRSKPKLFKKGNLQEEFAWCILYKQYIHIHILVWNTQGKTPIIVFSLRKNVENSPISLYHVYQIYLIRFNCVFIILFKRRIAIKESKIKLIFTGIKHRAFLILKWLRFKTSVMEDFIIDAVAIFEILHCQLCN